MSPCKVEHVISILTEVLRFARYIDTFMTSGKQIVGVKEFVTSRNGGKEKVEHCS